MSVIPKIYILMVAPPISNPKQHNFNETPQYSSFWFIQDKIYHCLANK